MCKGFMRVSREKVSDFEWLDNPTICYCFFRLLFKANYKDGRWQGIEVKRGQLLTGRKSLSDELNLTERQIRTCLEKLTATGYIDQQTTNKYTIITICNYDNWQDSVLVSDQQNVTQTTNKRPTNDQQTTTIEISKEVEELKKENERLKEELANASKKKETSSELETEFDNFRKKYKQYGGQARGLQTELDNLKKKHKDWKEIIPLLSYAIDKENAARKNAEIRGAFFPSMKNLQTYINQRSWEAYADEQHIVSDNEYHPTTDGIFQFWNPERNCLILNNGYIDQLNDGYTDDTRPDGAKVAWSMYEWVWSSQTKQWIKQNE